MSSLPQINQAKNYYTTMNSCKKVLPKVILYIEGPYTEAQQVQHRKITYLRK